jgi:hypothetical protein
MRILTPLVLAPALLLAACNDSADRQADANSEQRRSGQQVATTPNPPASTPETTGSINRPNAAPSTTGTLPASAPGAGAATLAGRSFKTNSGTLQFMADNRFMWRDQAGKTMTGRYVQEAERISFNDVQGDAGASTPMTCRFRMDGQNKFVVEESGTTCPVFRGLTFDAQG